MAPENLFTSPTVTLTLLIILRSPVSSFPVDLSKMIDVNKDPLTIFSTSILKSLLPRTDKRPGLETFLVVRHIQNVA